MRNVGDQVFIASAGNAEKWQSCPDCFGKKFLTVILGDDSRVTIDCAGCAPGFQVPQGRVRVYEYSAETRSCVISGFEVRGGSVKYHVGGEGIYNIYPEDRVFSTEGEALEGAEALVKKEEEDQRRRILKKEKDEHTWAWNATYHRKCIRDAEKALAHHSEKLEVAKTHEKKKPVEEKVT